MRRTDNLITIMYRLSRNSGSFYFPEPYEFVQDRNGIAFIIIIIIIIIMIIGEDTISFMQGIYTYIPEINHVRK
jgi:predicted RND superfamily exporter protein